MNDPITKKARLMMATTFLMCLVLVYWLEHQEVNDPAATEPVREAIEKPDFAEIKDVKQKKAAFFAYINALVQQANQAVLKERQFILTIQKALKQDAPMTNTTLINLCEKYKASCDQQSSKATIKNLLYHIDFVPPSLAMAQAANESAWGTSRFAVEANNYFGQWCYQKGCGLVPKQRGANSYHEVRRFTSPYGSVAGYIHNLNTSKAYKRLRKIRHNLRTTGKEPTGLLLAQGLTSYSERGAAYVKEIQAMIRHNKLQQYDAH